MYDCVRILWLIFPFRSILKDLIPEGVMFHIFGVGINLDLFCIVRCEKLKIVVLCYGYLELTNLW